MEYVLPLQEGDATQRHTTTLHMMLAFLLFGIGFTCLAIYWVFPRLQHHLKFQNRSLFLLFGLLAVLMSGMLVWMTVRMKQWQDKKRTNRLLRIAELAMMIGAAVLFFAAGWKVPAALFCVMLALLLYALFNEVRIGEAPTAVFDESRISLNGAAGKRIEWQKVSRVLLRHDILTISLVSNKLIQHSISAAPVIPSEFEQWCQTQIAAHAGKRDETW